MSDLDRPESWASTILRELCTINPRNRDIDDNTLVSFVPMSAVDDVTGMILSPEVKPWGEVKSGYTHFQEGDVIFAKITPCMENGKFAVARGLTNEIGAGSTEFHVFRCPLGVIPEFLWSFFRQQSFIKAAEKNMTGSAGQKRVPADYMKAIELPLPPTGEQRRIVAKIESTHEKIKAIESAVDEAEKLLGKYRESLLSKAFRGELVPQDPNDEPASQLLARIRAEREANQEGRRRRSELPPITEDEIPFEIPPTWEWVRVGEVSTKVQYGYTASSVAIGEVRFLRITDISESGVEWSTVPFCEIDNDDLLSLQLNEGDIVIARTGGTIGKNFLIRSVPGPAVFASYLIRICANQGALLPEYLSLFMSSPAYWNFVTGNQRGAAQPNINGTTLSTLPVPLPPLREQVRIVSALRNALKKITDQFLIFSDLRKYSTKSAQSILADAFTGKLVPQDPSEGTGHELLERIRAASVQQESASPTSQRIRPRRQTRSRRRSNA